MLSKGDAEAVRRQNRRLAIEHFRREPAATRRRLSEATGLSFSAASSIVSDLLREGVLRETEAVEAPARRGRPELDLALAPDRARVAVVKVTVGEITVHVADYAGRTVASKAEEADLIALGGAELAESVAALIAGTGVEDAGRPLDRIVVAVQGVTDAAGRRLLWSPILKARDVDIAGVLEDRFGAPVTVANDCGLMPERFRWGGGIDAANFATLFIGFGVGMGLKLSGTTFRGTRSSAVEFGHLNHLPNGDPCRCGNRGCIEAYAGDYAIWRAARGPDDRHSNHRVEESDMRSLAEAARSGEPRARAAFERAGEAIGYGLGRMFTLIDPVPIAFVGSGTLAMDIIEPSIRRAVGESAIDGIGRDVAFSVFPDYDAVLLDASLSVGLAALDDAFAGPNGAAANHRESASAVVLNSATGSR